MKTFANKNPRTLEQAVSIAQQARKDGQAVSIAGGGSDLIRNGAGTGAAKAQGRSHLYRAGGAAMGIADPQGAERGESQR